MEIKTINITEIKASENMVLTNGEAYSSVGGSIYLGCNDKAENWHEITKEEYEASMKEREEKMKGERI